MLLRYNIGDWTRHCRKKPSLQCDIVQKIVSDVEFVAENIGILKTIINILLFIIYSNICSNVQLPRFQTNET